MQNASNLCQAPANLSGLLLWAPINNATGNVIGDIAMQNNGVLSGFIWTAYNGVFPTSVLPTSYVYNSFNQVIRQSSPDGGLSEFWYDRLGRLVVSQNAQQRIVFAGPGGNLSKYSYKNYDPLGRITQVGEKEVLQTNDIRAINTLHDAALQRWQNAYVSNKQVTKTIYDTAVDDALQSMGNSRKKVVAIIYKPSIDSPSNDSTLFSYDIGGNVRTVVQHLHELVEMDAGNGKKRIDYDYNLVSGKVNKVSYQQGKGDQFFYKYLYDADNRILEAQSSRDNFLFLIPFI